MRLHRRTLVFGLAIAASALAAGAAWFALAPAAAPLHARAAASDASSDGDASGPSADAAAAPPGAAPGELAASPLAFPSLLPREPAVRPGIGSVLAGRPVRPGERLPGSPYASWIRREQVVRTPAGVEVALWSGGSGEPPTPAKGTALAARLPASPIQNAVRTWFVTTTAGGRTSVLALHDSPPDFANPSFECSDETTAPAFRLARPRSDLVWIELEVRLSCGRVGELHPSPAPGDAAADDGRTRVERRLGFVVAAGADGGLWRLAAAIPLREKLPTGQAGALAASLSDGGALTLRAGYPAPFDEQLDWVGEYRLEPLLQQAMAAPTWIDEALPIGPVSPTCAPRADAPRLWIAADAPVAAQPWARNPEVMVLAVPRGLTRVRIRAYAVDSTGVRSEVSDDPCLRLQLVGGGLRPMPVRTLYEVVGGAEPLETATIIALYRGQRILLRFTEGPPLPPAIPPAAAALLTGAEPGLRPPEPALCPGWDLFAAGPGVVLGDLDGDGQDDVAVLLLDAQRWELAILKGSAGSEYRLSFSAGAPRARPVAGAVEQLALRRTAAGDVSLRRSQGGEGAEWIIHWNGRSFTRTALPLLRPGLAGLAIGADQLGIAPRGGPIDEATVSRDALVASIAAQDAEAFAALSRMDPARRAAVAGWVVEALGRARGDRTPYLVALATLGRPAADVAVPALASLLYGGEGRWRSPLEPEAVEWALGRMGEPALYALALHPAEPQGVIAAADILREQPELRSVYAEAFRGAPRNLAAALASAPITTPAELVEALRLLPLDPRHVLARLSALAQASPRTPELGALLSAAVPVLVDRLATPLDPAEAAELEDLLGELGPLAAPATAALQTALSSPDCRLRVGARRALASIRGVPAATSEEAARDLAVECAIPAAQARPDLPVAAAPPARLPASAFIVRLLDRIDHGGYGFAAPVDLDWRRLAAARLDGVDVESGRGPRVERAREQAAQDAYQPRCLPFEAPLPVALKKAHYYGVTVDGVAPLDPRQVLGEVCVGASGIARYQGRVAAESGGDGFVIVSGAELAVSDVSRAALDRLWPAVAAACGIDPGSEPRGIAFRLGRGPAREQYAYAVLPGGDLCQDRRRLLRIRGGTAEVVEATDSACSL